jgi:hypothetical protein
MSRQTANGKGDTARPYSLPWEVRDLNWDLAAGTITKQQRTARLAPAWARARKRGWRGPRR